jgi:hypothetical protein
MYIVIDISSIQRAAALIIIAASIAIDVHFVVDSDFVIWGK